MILYGYETIPLQVYVDVANTGNYRLLSLKGGDDIQCFQSWEQIVLKNAEKSGTTNVDQHIDLLKSYIRLLADMNYIKAALTKLRFEIDDKLIRELADKGYRISTTGASSYLQSIITCERKSENLRSKILSKQHALKLLSQQASDTSKLNLHEMIAAISMGLGFQVPPDILLAAYNEYKRLLKIKYDNVKPHGR